jgi:hypothetical protein
MTSVFTWLDQSDQQRRKVLDLLAMFRERETVDELGLGTVRNAFADILFPGTSAPQTRARYFFFVPWMYLHLERKRIPSSEIKQRAKRFELDLIEALVNAGESDGVIGKVARRQLQRLPSNVYWSGLRSLRVFVGDASQDGYHESLDKFYQRARDVRTDDGDPIGGRRGNWHPKLPEAPEQFNNTPSLELRRPEAEFLCDQIQVSAPSSLFAALVREGEVPEEEYPWDGPERFEYSPVINQQLHHARNFSKVMHGAALLYNLILAELTKNEELQSEYQQAMTDWAHGVKDEVDLERWPLNDLWSCVESEGARVGVPTKAFVTEWCREAIGGDPRAVASSKRARDLVERRERALKRKLARVDNQRARDRWAGAAGTARLAYRWPNASRIAADIIKATSGKNNA